MYTHTQFHCVCVPYFTIHSCVDGLLCIVHFLAIVNRADVNKDVQVFLWQDVEYFQYKPRVVQPDHMVILFMANA